MNAYANSDRPTDTIAATLSKPGSPNLRSMSSASLAWPLT